MLPGRSRGGRRCALLPGSGAAEPHGWDAACWDAMGWDGMLAAVPGHQQSPPAACPAPRAQSEAPDLSWSMSTATGGASLPADTAPRAGQGDLLSRHRPALLASEEKLHFPSLFLSALPHHIKYQRSSGEYLISNLSNQSARPCTRERVAALSTKSLFYSPIPRSNYIHKICLLT